MGAEWLDVLALCLLLLAAAGAVMGLRIRRAGRSLVEQWTARRRRQTAPSRRPLEDVARDARRLGTRLRQLPDGASYVKVESVRFAYDRALAEACQCLGIDHLLLVLPPGDDLDAERARVESRLWLAGLRVDGS